MRLNLSEILESPNSVEELICKPLHEVRYGRLLEDVEIETLSMLLIATDSKIDTLYLEIKAESIIPEVLEKRQLAVFGNRLLDKKTILAIVILTSGTVGMAIQYLYYLQWWAKTNQIELPWFDFETEFCQKIFNLGVFKDEDLTRIWEETKVVDDLRSESDGPSEGWCGDNLIDYIACTKSLIIK